MALFYLSYYEEKIMESKEFKQIKEYLKHRKEDKYYKIFSNIKIDSDLKSIVTKELNSNYWRNKFNIGYYKDYYAEGITLSKFINNILKYVGLEHYKQTLNELVKYIKAMYNISFSDSEIKEIIYYRMFYKYYVGFLFEDLLIEFLQNEGFEIIQSKELDNIAGTGKTIVEDDKVTYKETGNEYYIKYEDDENGNLKINIKTREECFSDKEYETGDLTDDEKTQLESGIKLEINSGSKGEFLVQVEYGGIIDWGDGTYSKVEDPYTGKIRNKSKKIAYINNDYSKLNSIKMASGVIEKEVWHEYSEKNKIYTVKIFTNTIIANSEALLKIVDWGECELREFNFSNSTNLTEIASPKEKSFNKDPWIFFQNCTSLKQIPADFFNNISNLWSVESMFENCTSLTGNAIELWNNSNIEYQLV